MNKQVEAIRFKYKNSEDYEWTTEMISDAIHDIRYLLAHTDVLNAELELKKEK